MDEKTAKLNMFEKMLELYDGMLIETGGNFGRLDGDKYKEKCFELAKDCIKNGSSKEQLLQIVEYFIDQYKEDIQWRFWSLEMKFLNSLKVQIESL
jgi:hypothetical protein